MSKLYINSICIGLLAKCNWTCKYCIARNDNATIDEVQILEDLMPHLNKLKTLYISGGEPGLLSEDFWSKVFSSIDFQLRICTNGTFFKNGLYFKFRNDIKELMVHVVQELDMEIEEDIYHALLFDDKLTPVIVVHRHNAHLLKDFLEKYPLITFQIFFSDGSFTVYHYDGEYQYGLDVKSAKHIIKAFSGKPRYLNYTTRIMKCLVKNDFKNVNSWSNKNHE